MKPYDASGIAYAITREVFAKITERPMTKLMFDGETFDAERDGKRLGTQLERVQKFMSDGRWATLVHIAEECGGTESSVSARLRDLRKPKFGGYTIERQYVANGLFKYRMAPKEGADGAGA